MAPVRKDYQQLYTHSLQNCWRGNMIYKELSREGYFDNLPNSPSQSLAYGSAFIHTKGKQYNSKTLNYMFNFFQTREEQNNRNVTKKEVPIVNVKH